MLPREPVIHLEAGAVFRGYRPRGHLAAVVELIWTVEGVPSERAGERILPNGVIELIFNLGDPHRVVRGPGRFTRYRRAWIAGLQRGPLDIVSERESRLLGVRFRPGGAAPVLGLPLHPFTDEVVEIEGALAPALLPLRERLLEARSDAERVGIVEDGLERLARGRAVDGRIARAVALLDRGGEATTVRSIADALGVSHKHLIDLFHREVGVAPKTLGRILRFHRVVAAASAPGAPRWTDLAHEHGYADQAHLVGDFRALAGVTPTEYLRACTVDPNHLSAQALAERPRRR